MKIKKGDTVQLIAGKDRGKKGKVLEARPGQERVVVEGLNLLNKHQRPRREGQKGQKIQIPRAVSVSNVMLVCPRCGEPTRVGWTTQDSSKERQCKKCKATL